MSFEDAVVPAIQVVIGSWVAIMTAGAGYLFIQHVRFLRTLDGISRRLAAIDAILPLGDRLADAEAFSERDDDDGGDASARR